MDLRPAGVLPIGLACETEIFGGGNAGLAVEAALANLLGRLKESFEQVVANSDYFSGEPALCRILTLSDASLLALQRRDAPSANVQIIDLDTTIPSSSAEIEASKGAGKPDRAREQAYQLLLANIDLLLVVWDGQRAARRGGIDTLVQSAVTRKLPVIVIAPTPAAATYMLLQNEDDLDAPIALDLAHRQLPFDLGPLINKIMLPTWPGARRCLMDLCAEPRHRWSPRIEYDLLLSAFRVRTKSRGHPTTSQPDVLPAEFRQRTERLDQLAGYYANLTRASSTSKFLVFIIVALLSSVFGLLVPSLSGVSIFIQVIVNGLIMFDIIMRRRHRWDERWLDYRALAERLRAIQTLHPIGQGDGQFGGERSRHFRTWTDWYGRRVQRMLVPPAASIGDAELPGIADGLRAAIEDQLSYHRRAFVQLRKLEHRLFITARVALSATILIGIGIFVADHIHIGVPDESWHRIALLALAVLPAAVSAFNGIRADADLAQLVERSALTASNLMRLRRALNSAPLTRDRVVNAAVRLVRLMENELSEWRLMLNSRRLRRSR